MPGNYAKGTTVSPARTRAEIETTLTRFGVQAFAYGTEAGQAGIYNWDGSIEGPPPRLIVVGPRENIFHCHPATEVYPDFGAFLAHEKDM